MRIHDRALARFTEWFGSGAGVWQTTVVVLAVTVYECFNRTMDPHAFILMAVLTVYSAITQPALAHAGEQNNLLLHTVIAQQSEALSGVKKILSDECVVDGQTHELVKRIAAALNVEASDDE